MKGREGCQKQRGILHARKHAHHVLQQIRLGVDVVILLTNLRHHLPITPQTHPHLVERRVSLQLRRVFVLQQIEHGGCVPLSLISILITHRQSLEQEVAEMDQRQRVQHGIQFLMAANAGVERVCVTQILLRCQPTP